MKALYLSHDWRIIADPLQWILQKRNTGTRDTRCRWQPDSFCRRRDPLLAIIKERCGADEPTAIAYIQTWPKLKVEGEDLLSPPKTVAERLRRCRP